MAALIEKITKKKMTEGDRDTIMNLIEKKYNAKHVKPIIAELSKYVTEVLIEKFKCPELRTLLEKCSADTCKETRYGAFSDMLHIKRYFSDCLTIHSIGDILGEKKKLSVYINVPFMYVPEHSYMYIKDSGRIKMFCSVNALTYDDFCKNNITNNALYTEDNLKVIAELCYKIECKVRKRGDMIRLLSCSLSNITTFKQLSETLPKAYETYLDNINENAGALNKLLTNAKKIM